MNKLSYFALFFFIIGKIPLFAMVDDGEMRLRKEIDTLEKELLSINRKIAYSDVTLKILDQRVAKKNNIAYKSESYIESNKPSEKVAKKSWVWKDRGKPAIHVKDALAKVLQSNDRNQIAIKIAKDYSMQGLNASASSEIKQCPIHAIFFNHSLCKDAIAARRNMYVTYALRALLMWGADCNAQDYLGNTALHYAAMQKNHEAVSLLCTIGAGVNVCNNEGNVPLLELIKIENNYKGPSKKIVKMLTNAGSDTQKKNNNGDSIDDYVALKEKYRATQKPISSMYEAAASLLGYQVTAQRPLSRLGQLIAKSRKKETKLNNTVEISNEHPWLEKINRDKNDKDKMLPIHYAGLLGLNDIFDFYPRDKSQQIQKKLFGNEGIFTAGQLLLLSSPLWQIVTNGSRKN